MQDPKTHAWVHTTLFQVPANTRVNMTILGYDGCTPLRNNYWSQIQGTVGNAITVQQFKTVGQPISPVRKILGPQLLVRLQRRAHVRHPQPARVRAGGLPDTALFNNSPCTTSPCTEGPHSMVKFSFFTPKHAGTFRWQCFVPCGGGFLDGNGGPMQTLGYMMGNMEVSA